MTTDRPRKKSRSQRRQKPKRYGTTKKSVLLERSKDYIEEVETRANERFERKERVMGFPDELPIPKNHKFEWQTNPVPLKDEESLAKFVIKKGEFGWLEDSRVDEIGRFVDGKNMNLDQALSLRSALLQQKTVFLKYSS